MDELLLTDEQRKQVEATFNERREAFERAADEAVRDLEREMKRRTPLRFKNRAGRGTR